MFDRYLFAQVEAMVEEFDDDGSGLIEFDEFLVIMAKKVDIGRHKFARKTLTVTQPADKDLPL